MKNIKGILPGIFTMGNLGCGFGAIIVSGWSHNIAGADRISLLNEAVWLIILAAFFDVLDGIIARFSKASSRFGVELDSLADIIAFGVAPAAIIINFSLITKGNWAWILAFVYLMAATFRLARFNMTASLGEKTNFLGMPVPVAAVTIVSFLLFGNEALGHLNLEKYYTILIVLTSALMVSGIEFETMPRLDFSKTFNKLKFLFLIATAIGMMINASLVMFPLIAFYIIYAISHFIITVVFRNNKGVVYSKPGGFRKKKKNREDSASHNEITD